jgi:hypothetical protein
MEYGDLEEDTLYVCFIFNRINFSSLQLILYSSGMTLTSGTCTLKKDAQNLVGISIGGGAPLCPCLYIVQIFDNTAASRDGSLAAGSNQFFFFIIPQVLIYLGDEIVSVNGKSVKGRTKVEVAKLIQACKVKHFYHLQLNFI